MKLNKAKLKLNAWKGMALIAGSLIAVGAYAAGGFSWSNVEDKAAEKLVAQIQAPEESQMLGAVSSPDAFPAMICSAGNCTYTAVVDFYDASTTIVSIQDPFLAVTTTGEGDVVLRDDGVTEWTGASSTVSVSRLDITGAATTTFQVFCGASASAQGVPVRNLVTSAAYVTSSLGSIENNLTAANGGLVDGGTVAKIAVGHSFPYFNCLLTSVSSTAALTSDNNSFAGKATVVFSRTR